MRINKKELIVISLVVGLAFLLRILYLNKQMFFGYEQARDLLLVKEIINGDIKLLGPPTDIPGIYHGVIYFYLLLPLYKLFNGDPFIVQSTLIAINSVAIYFLYDATKKYYDKRTGVIAALLYALSYSAIIYSRWLSNTTLIPAASILLFYFLVYSKTNWKYLLGAMFSLGLVINFHEVTGVSLVIPTIAFILIERIKLNLSRVMLIIITFVLTLSSYFVFELKNDFLMSKILIDFSHKQGGLGSSGLSFIFDFLTEATDSIYPLSPKIAFVGLMFVIIVFSRYLITTKKYQTLIIFTLAQPIVFGILGIVPLRHFYISVPVYLSILIAVSVDRLVEINKVRLAYGLLLLVIIGNLVAYISRIPINASSFIYNAQRTYLGDLKSAIDYIYIDADGKPFSYNYYSIPYWHEEMWEYMFSWYGLTKYGYLPDRNRTDIFYTVMEPNLFIPVHRDNWYGEYKKQLNLIDTQKFGDLIVEKRSEVK